MRAIIATLALLLTAATATAAIAAEPDYPAPNGRRVIDEADQIPADVEERLTNDLRAFQQKTGHEMVIVTVPTLDGVSKEEYAIGYGRHWGIGRKGADDGIVMMESPGDGTPGSGQVFIAVGRGIDPYLTDFATSQVFNKVMAPVMRGDAGSAGQGLDRGTRIVKGIEAGTAALIKEGSITPAQRKEMDRRIALQRARDHQALMDALEIALYWVIGLAAAAGSAFGIWWHATRERRALRKAAALAREKAAAEALAAQRAKRAADRAQMLERQRLERERVAQEREAMLAAMSPADRQAFLDEEERRAREQREAQARRDEERRARAARDRAKQEERDRRDQSASTNWGSALGGAAGYDAPSPQAQNDYNPGGGDFGGAGAGGSF